jgi:transcriptional regulator with XRE-family HTH domain
MLVRVNKGLLIAYERCGLERLSEVLGVTNQTIYNYRNGKRQLSLSDAGRLSIALRVAWLNFLQWEEVPTVSVAKKGGK